MQREHERMVGVGSSCREGRHTVNEQRMVLKHPRGSRHWDHTVAGSMGGYRACAAPVPIHPYFFLPILEAFFLKIFF